jgi:hypothetical protein
LAEKGHEFVSVGRKSGDYQGDISDPECLKTLFRRIGSFDAMANAAGDVSFGALEESTDEQRANSIKFKGIGPDQPGPGCAPLHCRQGIVHISVGRPDR